MIIGVPTEVIPGERRVALVPDAVRRLVEAGLDVVVETGAGTHAGHGAAAYEEVGARLEPDVARLYASADLVAKVRTPAPHPDADAHEAALMREGAALIGLIAPFDEPEVMRRLAERRVTSFSLELMPRITRAQGTDALSSMSTVAGYASVIIAAEALPKLMPMLMTAAGTLAPARVLVIGAGVAGLQAIATARRLGAIVEAYDVRTATKEQVESLGARFVELEEVEDAETEGGYAREQSEEQQARQRELLTRHIAESDAVISTALVPGRPAPKIITEEQVKEMRPRSVIVDLAAERGGNCTLTRPGEIVQVHGVAIHGPLDLPSAYPLHASQMYARNMLNYIQHLVTDGKLQLDLDDEMTRDPLVTHEGEITNASVREALSGDGAKD